MNDDMERRLRELFEDKATESAAASRAPEPVVKRARRRQVGTIAVSVVTVFALAGVSFAGIRTLNGTGERGLMPADISPYDSGRYPVFERTAVIESLSVTSPSDWYLVNQWPLGAQIATQSYSVSCTDAAVSVPAGASGSSYGTSGSVRMGGYGASGSYGPSGSNGNCTSSASPETDLGGLPVLQLSNRDLGLSMPACGLGGTPPMPMTGDDAVMAVVIDYEAIAQDMPDSVQPDEPLAIDGSGEPDEDLCGPGYYRKFVSEGVPFVAWASFGPDVTQEDRDVALNALTLAGNGFFGGSPRSAMPSYVLAGGDWWRLELTPSANQANGGNVDLSLVSLDGGTQAAGTGDFTVPAVPVESCCDPHMIGGPGKLSTPIRFGAVDKNATGVELRPSDGQAAIEGTLVPLPPSLMNFPFDLFIVNAPAEVDGKVVATGLATPTPAVTPADPTITLSPSPDTAVPSQTPQPGVPTIEGRGLGLHWRASSTIENGEACIYVTIDDIMESADACGDSSAPVLGVHAVDGGTILFGVLPPEPVAVEWETEDGMASGSVMFVSSGPREEGIPFVTAIPAAAITKGHGQLVVRFPGEGDSVAYPEWRTDLPN